MRVSRMTAFLVGGLLIGPAVDLAHPRFNTFP
jgi:hypothetical protein